MNYRKKLLAFILALLVLTSSASIVFASDISDAEYFGIVVVSNNGTAADGVATVASINTTNLQNLGYLNAAANNTALQNASGADVPFMPGYTPGGYPWAIWVDSIGAAGVQSNLLYTANSTGGEIRYFPGSGGMSVADNASLELGDNFTVQTVSYVQTDNASGKDIVVKAANSTAPGFSTFVSPTVSGNITSRITSDNASTQYWGSEDAQENFTSTQMAAQTFHMPTGATGYLIYRVDVRADDAAQTTTANLSIRNASLGVPTGADLIVKQFTPTGDWGAVPAWRQFDFNTPLAVSPNASLAVVMSTTDGINADWTYDNTAPSYAEGNYALSVDQGFTWTPTAGNDFLFTVYYYPFVEVSATSVTSGDRTVLVGTNGTITGGLDLNGTNGVALVTDAASIQNVWDGGGSLAWWCYARSRGASNAGNYFYKNEWAARATEIDATHMNLIFSHDWTGAVGSWKTTNRIVPLDEWSYIVVRYSSDNTSNDMELSINDVDYTVGNGGLIENGTPIGARKSDAGLDLAIGEDYDLNRHIDAIFDEITIYSRTLTAAEITSNYAAGVGREQPVSQTNLEAWYHTDEGSGPTLFDQTANANDAAITSATYTTGHVQTQFVINVDGTPYDGTRRTTVPNTSDNWTLFKASATPYAENATIWISDNVSPVSGWSWQYNTVFADTFGGNTATPTFRTASSDPDVSANLTSFGPVAQSQAPAYTLDTSTNYLPDSFTGNISANFSTTAANGTFPLAQVIAAISGAGASPTPAQLPLLIIVAFVIIAASLTTSYFMRRFGTGSLVAKWIVIVALMGIFLAIGNFAVDYWMLIVFTLIAVALMMMSRHQSTS